MELIQAAPFLRFADRLRFEIQRGPSKTYDCRMLYALAGAARVEVEGACHPMHHGSLVLFQPGTRYTIFPEPAVDLIVFDFDFTQDYSDVSTAMITCTLAAYAPENAHERVQFSDAPVFDGPVYLDNITFIEALLQEIVAEFSEKRLLYLGKCSTLFKSVLFDIARYERLGRKSDSLVRQVIRYIDANLGSPITNRQLGAHFNYNPNYLNRLMLMHTGKTLHQYVLGQRMAQALKLLQTTDMSITQIALSLGFHSLSHFSRSFKKETGFAPAQFREE